MPTFADLALAPLIALKLSVLLGFGLALLRAPRTGSGWIALDALAVIPLLVPASLLANGVLLASGGGIDRLAAWTLAATLAALPLAYFPLRLALARTVETYRDTAALLGYGCATRLWRIDLPLLWPVLLLGVLLAATRISAEWFLVIGNLERFTPLTAALAALVLAAAVAASLRFSAARR